VGIETLISQINKKISIILGTYELQHFTLMKDVYPILKHHAEEKIKNIIYIDGADHKYTTKEKELLSQMINVMEV
jgi:hypothetical protein